MPKKATKRSIEETWSEIAKDEAAAIDRATKAVEKVPAPADMVDKALVFAANTLRSQREALVPLLKGVTPRRRQGENTLPPVAAAVSAAYKLAERVVETQRRLLHGLVEAVTPPLARHSKGHAARPIPRRRPAHRAVRRGRRRVAAA